MSACPGGDCGAGHSSDHAACHPLSMTVLRPEPQALKGWDSPQRNGYASGHGA